MILLPFVHTDPVALSYLFGCGGKAIGAVVDPVTDPTKYMDEAARVGAPIRYVIDTHIHADHHSTGISLAAASGAEYVLFHRADVALPFRGVRDGELLELGNVAIEVLHTPGHTPEHICLLVTDRTRSREPWFVLTGHTLMVGDVGRTELAATAEDGARALFASLKRLKSLQDYVEVLPGAYAGSVCGRRLSGKSFSTLGFERRNNLSFRIEEETEFVGEMLKEIPPPPPDAAATRARNAGRAAA